MRKLLVLSFVLFITANFLVSCCGCSGAKILNPHTLTSDSWALVEMDGSRIPEGGELDSFTLTFDAEEQRIFGKAECNSYFATYSESDVRKIRFDAMGSTKMMCRDQQLEDKYNQILSTIDSYTIDGDMLLLQCNQEVKLIFQAIALIEQ